MYILGISAFYHDSAAALLHNGEIIAAVQEERFTRKKHDPSFPVESIRYCLDEAGINIDDLSAVVFYEKPLLKFERLLETYYAFAPKGFVSFLKAMPVWMKEKLFLKNIIRKGLKKVAPYDKRKLNLLFSEHHLSHAASAYYPSPFTEAAILTIDGVGEWTTASISHAKGNEITILKEMRFPHSLGLLYSSFTYYLGFKVNGGEYKLMGLAPYGNHDSNEVKEFKEKIKLLADFKEDGSIWIDQRYFNYATGMRMANDKKWEQLFGFPRKEVESEIAQHHCDLALAIQEITEDAVLKMAKATKEFTGFSDLCMSGGVALNCVANGKLHKAGLFDNIFIQPASGDAGGALGAALAVHYIHYGQKRSITQPDAMKSALLGPVITDESIDEVIKKFNVKADKQNSYESICDLVAKLIDNGAVVGWAQGRMEYGPRALGNRSILADPKSREMQQKLNLKIKKRESFRPFAPVMLEEEAMNYFSPILSSPYMLFTSKIKNNNRLVNNGLKKSLKEKLHDIDSPFPAVTHVDYSARMQTVNAASSPLLHQLLQAVKQQSGTGILVNTSFNERGEPIVCTADDAFRCFMRTDMDYLVINNYLFNKKEQPQDQSDLWNEQFELD